jgi:hypothetical protein
MLKKFWQNSISFYDNNLKETRNRMNIPQYYKDYIWQTNSQYILNGEKNENISSTIRMRQDCPLSVVLRVCSTEYRQRNKTGERYKIQKCKKEVKLFLFVADMILYLQMLKPLPKTASSHKHVQQKSGIQS